jgi:nucleotide-binding universal stress UspA family protein
MYKRILLAYDGTLEGRAALREGALLARRCGAEVFLLSVIAESVGSRVAQGVEGATVAVKDQDYQEVLADGIERLKQLGFAPVAKLMRGEPARAIGVYSGQIAADLVVVGYRKQNALARWWSGPSGAYLIDHVSCSVLVGRNVITAEAFEAEMRDGPAAVTPNPAPSPR